MHSYGYRDSRAFTAHAAVQLREWRKYSTSYSRYGDEGEVLEEVSLDETSEQLKCLVQETFPTCNVNVIHFVNAPQMYGMYLLRKEEMLLTYGRHKVQELVLYHVTTKSRAVESLKSGLDWRLTCRSKYGRGVSFSDDADYANYYADNRSKEGNRVIIVCAVLVYERHRVNGNPKNSGELIVPPGSADTTVSPNGRVYVKYNDFDFYPLYLMHYLRTPEHLNESKYFANNPRLRRQRISRVKELDQLMVELHTQRFREQTQRELQERRYLEQEPERRRQEQASRRMQLEQEQARRMQVEQEQARRMQLEQEQARRMQLEQEQARRQRERVRQENKSYCLIL